MYSSAMRKNDLADKASSLGGDLMAPHSDTPRTSSGDVSSDPNDGICTTGT